MFHNFTHDSSVVELVLQKSFVSCIKVFLAQNEEIFCKNTIMGLASIPYKYIDSFSLKLIKNQFSCLDCVMVVRQKMELMGLKRKAAC